VKRKKRRNRHKKNIGESILIPIIGIIRKFNDNKSCDNCGHGLCPSPGKCLSNTIETGGKSYTLWIPKKEKFNG
jgi:hypothetical protein